MSYLLLFNCVIFFVVLGSVVCPPKPIPPPIAPPSRSGGTSSGDSSPSTSSPGKAFKKFLGRSASKVKEFLTGKDMINVTLIRHHAGNQSFPNGLVVSNLHYNGWFWHFFKAGDWEGTRPKSRAMPTNEFELHKMKNLSRTDATVKFTEDEGSYSLIFADEDAAKKFTGEAWSLTGG